MNNSSMDFASPIMDTDPGIMGVYDPDPWGPPPARHRSASSPDSPPPSYRIPTSWTENPHSYALAQVNQRRRLDQPRFIPTRPAPNVPPNHGDSAAHLDPGVSLQEPTVSFRVS